MRATHVQSREAMAATEDRQGADAIEEWRKGLYDSTPERDGLFTTISGLVNEPLYTPENVEIDYDRDLGYPGGRLRPPTIEGDRRP